MSTRSHAPLYDLFKLIVAILLLILLLFLMWGVTPPAPVPQPATLTPPPPTPSTTLRANFTAIPVSSTSPASTETPSLTPIPATETIIPSLTSSPALSPTETSTPTPSITIPPVTETLPTPIVEIPSEPVACAAISRARLHVGMRAVILRRLNFRSSPGIKNNWILTNIPGTQVEVLGGPVCTRYQNGGAYLWWQIKLPNGRVGWSAEASAFGGFYFIEPLP